MEEVGSKPQYNTHLLGYQEAKHQERYNSSRRRSSNLSDIYKNPQIYAALHQSSKAAQWNVAKKWLFLAPAFAFQFCSVLTSVFSNINMRLLNVPAASTSVHLVIASVLSICLMIVFQKCVQKQFGERRHLAMLLIGFTAYISVGVLLVLTSNLEILTNVGANNVTENTTTFIPGEVLGISHMIQESVVLSDGSFHDQSVSTGVKENNVNVFVNVSRNDLKTNRSTMSNESFQNVTTNHISISTQILAFTGYAILGSSFSCSHYLLSSIAMSVTHINDHHSMTTIETAAAALGGCAVSFLGAIDISFNGYSTNESTHLVIGQIFILLCIAIPLLVCCTACSMITWYSDIIIEKLGSRSNSEENILIAHDRRPTRTAQEIFDECAALLGHQDALTYMEESHSQWNVRTESREGISNSMSHSETVIDDSIHSNPPELRIPYAYQLHIPARNATRRRSFLAALQEQKKFILALIFMFFLSSSIVSVEYNSSLYLGYAVPVGEDRPGHRHRNNARIGSAGIFMMYLSFIAVYFFYERVTQRTGWRPLALVMGLTAALVTLALAISGEVAVYFVASCVLGCLRSVVVRLPGLLSVSSQIGYQTMTVRQILIETPTTIIWCMTPLSLGVSSAVIMPLNEVAGFHGTAMYYSAISAVMGCITLIALF